MFDLTISMGNILQIFAMLFGGLFFLYRMEARLIVLSAVQETFVNRLTNLETEVKKLADVTVEIARQDERMTSQDLRINTIAIRVDEYLRNPGLTHHRSSRSRSKG